MANAISLFVSALFGVTAFLISSGLGVAGIGATISAKAFYMAVEILLTTVSMALYAYLTGRVLRSIVPKLPMRGWLLLHLGIGVILGVISGFLEIYPEDDNTSDRTEYRYFMLIAGPIFGAFVGLILGGLQALILRKAAAGMLSWITFSTLATVALALVAFSITFSVMNGKSLEVKAIEEGADVIGGMIAAAIMLLALSRLRPKAEMSASD